MAAERKRGQRKAGKLREWLRGAGRTRTPAPKPAPKPAAGGKLADWLQGSKVRRKPAPKAQVQRKPASAAGGKLDEWLRGSGRQAAPKRQPQRRQTPKPQRKQKPTPKPAPRPAAVVRLLSQQQEDGKRLAKFRKAVRGFRVRKADRGTLVFISAKDGKRVGKGYRGKVFPLYVTKAGTVKPYTERGQRSRPPVPRTIRSLDPGQFRTRRSRQVAERILYAKTSRLLEPLVLKSRVGGGLDWDRRVTPKARDMLLEFAALNTQSFQAAIIWTAIVEVLGEDGSEFRTYTGAVDWKLSQAQVEQINAGLLPGQWVLPWIQSKLYADIAQKIGEAEFVTVGSARFVELLPINQDRERKDWIDARGRKWEKWDYQDVRMVNLTLEPRLVTITGSK